MTDELISVPDIAKLHARHRSVIHKIIGRLGIETHSIKSGEARGQKAVYISRNDCELLKEILETQGVDGSNGEEVSNAHGYFYIIQLEPALDAGRLKLGFAASIEDRLRSHRTSAPFASVIGYWPCKLLWEKTAIDCVASGCEELHTEVFKSGRSSGLCLPIPVLKPAKRLHLPTTNSTKFCAASRLFDSSLDLSQVP